MLRAGGAMLLLPAALLVSVAVTASVGGGLTGLGQVFVGPTVPEAAQAAQGAERPAGSTQAAAAVTGGFPAIPAVRVVPRLVAEETTGNRRRSTRRGQTRRPSGQQQPSRHVPSTVTQPTGTQPPASQPPPSQPPPARPEGPIRQIGKVVRDTVASIPVAGPPAADVVQTVIDLVEPPPAPKPPVAVPQG